MLFLEAEARTHAFFQIHDTMFLFWRKPVLKIFEKSPCRFRCVRRICRGYIFRKRSDQSLALVATCIRTLLRKSSTLMAPKSPSLR